MSLSTFLNDTPVSQLRGLQWLALSDTGQVAVSYTHLTLPTN